VHDSSLLLDFTAVVLHIGHDAVRFPGG
jgi:hypothetical protein